MSEIETAVGYKKTINKDSYSSTNIFSLICWSYILIISLPTLSISSMELESIKSLQNIYEPFSDTKLGKYYKL